ncbi:DUF4436 domain-containing protein [Cnuibacter physcomitrellae]|uniref:Uncharacterized protein n=1 Tax=Cnuibacter physcomitrellae TaxID=1619308 RepID=A0A1X9LSH0_9MICO|nr:DUF4436 family protein [Cnuibacter physcomitrellae]ARJ06089.1 hypothetical protein B5808_13310 [Cnuibacter physcomitrellae]GGI37192.1 DUF4436 domain-containing protein [Cnuibacter physcomitrellae]
MTPPAPVAPRSRGLLRSPRFWMALLLAALIVVTYVGLVALYATNGRTAKSTEVPEADVDKIVLDLTPQNVDGSKERISVDVDVFSLPEKYLQDKISVNQDITILINPLDGSPAIQLKAGAPVPMTSISVIVDGKVENWPFDKYETDEVYALAFPTAAGPSQAIPVQFRLIGQPPGWNIDLSESGAMYPDFDGSTVDLQTYDLSAKRDWSIITFGLVLLVLLVVMPVLVLFVAISAYIGRRRVEATLTSWMGTMLFATITVRNFFPGSPPIGSWVDILVVLWVIVGLVVGLAIYVAAWNRWGTPYSEYRGARAAVSDDKPETR